MARTGARMLVLPGADSAPKADALAEALRAVLDEEHVRISRPEKTVSLRVSGLDDCTHAEDVAAAIARTTNCPVGSIRASKIRPGPDGMGMTVVACPVAAAKNSQEGKLLVGWASALGRDPAAQGPEVLPLPRGRSRVGAMHLGGGPQRSLLPLRTSRAPGDRPLHREAALLSVRGRGQASWSPAGWGAL